MSSRGRKSVRWSSAKVAAVPGAKPNDVSATRARDLRLATEHVRKPQTLTPARPPTTDISNPNIKRPRRALRGLPRSLSEPQRKREPGDHKTQCAKPPIAYRTLRVLSVPCCLLLLPTVSWAIRLIKSQVAGQILPNQKKVESAKPKNEFEDQLNDQVTCVSR